MKTYFKKGTSYLTSHAGITRQNHLRISLKNKQKKAILFLLLMYSFGSYSIAQSSGNGFPTGMSKMDVRLLINTNAGSSNTADGCTILYKNNFLIGLGPEDSYKFQNVDENMALPVGNALLSIQGKPFVLSYDTIPLRIWKYRHTDYYLQFDATNFSINLAGVLKDNYLQQEYPISLTGSTLIHYLLTTDTASSSPNRFCIYLKPAGILPLNLVLFSASKNESGVQIEWVMANEANISQFEIEKATDPVLFIKKATLTAFGNTQNGLSHQWLDREATAGTCYYRLKSISKSGEIQYSKIVKVSVNPHTHGISVYPNPVKGNTVGLQMIDMEKANYSVKLYNSNGQQVFSTTLLYAGGTATQQLNIGNNHVKGTYTLRLSDGKNDFNKALLID